MKPKMITFPNSVPTVGQLVQIHCTESKRVIETIVTRRTRHTPTNNSFTIWLQNLCIHGHNNEAGKMEWVGEIDANQDQKLYLIW
jgi:hypothetical protein